MEKDEKEGKIERVLGIYTQLINGHVVSKAEEACRYGVDERSIYRDIRDIRNFLEREAGNTGYLNTIIYDQAKKGYRMEQLETKLSNNEILALCKILLDSRAFVKEEMEDMLDRLVSCCVPRENQKLVKEMIGNEEFHYVEPRHRTRFLDVMWDIAQAIRDCRYIEMDYGRIKGGKVVQRKVKPVAIMFSEYYFYLTAFIDDEEVRKDFDVINSNFPHHFRE